MITIKKEKPQKKKTEPYYLLRYDYMIGDANGSTDETLRISEKNPYLERYVKLLNSLKASKGTWGIVFDSYDFHKFMDEGQITKDDYEFLKHMMFEGAESEFVVEPENEEFSYEFYEGVSGETEYSFLVFEGISLRYVDEYGKKHKTEIK